MPKVPADSDDVPAEWRTSGVPGDVARLSLLAEAIEEYIAASQVCEAAQDDLPYTSPAPPLHLPTSPLYLQVCEAAQDEMRAAALPQPVMDAAKVELAAQRKVSLQDVEVGASSDAVAAFLSGVVGQYEAGAVIEELRRQGAEGRRGSSSSRRGSTGRLAASTRSSSSRLSSSAREGEESSEPPSRLSLASQPSPQRRRGPAPRPGSAGWPSARCSMARPLSRTLCLSLSLSLSRSRSRSLSLSLSLSLSPNPSSNPNPNQVGPQRSGAHTFGRVGRAVVMGGRIAQPVVLTACAAEGFATSRARLSQNVDVERVHVPKADSGTEPQCNGGGGGGGGGGAAGPDSRRGSDALQCSTRQITRRPSVTELVQQSEVRGKSRPASAKLFHRAAALHGFLARIQPGEVEGSGRDSAALDETPADELVEQAFDPSSLPLFRDAPSAVQAEVSAAELRVQSSY